MFNVKRKVLLIGLVCCLAACSSNTAQDASQTAAQGAATGSGAGQRAARSTPLPTRVVANSTSVSADGVLTLGTPALSLGFDVSGKVSAVNVSLGQAVKKGEVLATIDATSLQDAVADAELALKLVQANASQQNAPATKEDLAAAQASLSAAYVSYNTTKSGSTASELESARVSAESAWLQYLSAQSARDITCGNDRQDSAGCKSQEASYGSAYEGMLAARDNYQKLQEPVSQNTLTQAYTSVATAKAKLDSLKAGVSEAARTVTEAQLTQSQAALTRAQNNLSQARLVSPCDCIVQEINVAVGVNAPSAAFTLVNLSGIQFKTTNLTERDVAKIQAGAAATIRLKPYSDEFTGKVSAVLALSSGTQSSSALFTALIDVDPAGKQLLPGMTGQAEVVVQ